MSRVANVIKVIICVVVITTGFATYRWNIGNDTEAEGKYVTMGQEVYKGVLRFHVLANSDSDEDQAVKLKVKDEVVTKLAEDMSYAGISSKQDAYRYVNDNMDYYIDEATRVLRSEGYDYEVKGELGKCWFPVKIYGNCVYPEGEYDAFRIMIGKAEGKNWWCVLFPSLCMIDEACMVSETPKPAGNDMSEEQDVKIKLRIVEWIKEMW